MKLYHIAAILLAGSLSLSAQSKLNPAGSMMLYQWNQAKKNPDLRLQPLSITADNENNTVKALITLEEWVSYEEIALPGMVFDCTLPSGKILADLSLDIIEDLAANDKVTAISFGDKAEIRLDEARKSANVQAVHDGTGISQAYTGKGVLCGIYDTGMDPNHITFTNGGSRVVAFFNGSTTYTQANMSSAQPDTRTETHGTHCAGILAGNSAPRRSGSSTDGTFNSGYKNGSTFRPLAMPYQGVAKGADIYMIGGEGYDNSILAGVNRIVSYAKEKGQPAVVSLSWGSNVGPHDGSREICTELDALSKDAIIVIAAGNEGTYPLSVKKTLTSADNSLKTFVSGSGNSITGQFQFWANNSTKMTAAIGVYNISTNTVETIYNLPSSAQATVNASLISNTAFNSGSSITLENAVYAANQRAYITLNFRVTLTDSNTRVPFIVINGADGQTVNGVCTKSLAFSSRNISGYTNGTPDESISDLACGKGTIVVGAYTTKTSWGVMPATGTRGYNIPYTVDDIAPFSSYGTIFGGRTLPDVCAPGSYLISSISSYYTESNEYSPTSECDANGYYRSTNGRTYYFEAMQGTSMATPFVAGVIALWLEADPNLTTDDVRELLKKSCRKDNFVTNGNPIRWGYGKIDALQGIKEILNAGVNDITADITKRLVIEKNSQRNYTVSLPGSDRISVSLFAISGAEVLNSTASDSSVNIDASSLASGIYVLKATDSRGTYTEKIAL